jgi:plasmid stabilization system protein ParE
MAKVNWTNEAESWLKRIHDYIAQDNKDAAARLILSLYNRVEVLKEFPLIGQRLLDWPNRHIRVLLYGHSLLSKIIHFSDAHPYQTRLLDR